MKKLKLNTSSTLKETKSSARFAFSVVNPFVLLNKGQNRENRQGKDFGGVKGYLEGIWGDPSLTKIQGKTKKNLRKTKKN